MEILQLQPEQVTRAILNLLLQLNDTRRLTISAARLIIERQIKRDHFTYVMYDEGVPVGVGSLVVSERLIHNGSKIAQIEDIAIHKDFHGLGYGKLLVKHLIKIAKKHKVYKCILDCSQENIGFYQRCGLKVWHQQMRIDLK